MSEPAVPFVAASLAAPLPPSGIAWLDQARAENLAAFAEGGLPDTRVEAWKYTALRALSQRRFVCGDAQAATREVDATALAVPGVDGPRLVFVNGALRLDLSSLANLPAGLHLQPLSQALAQDAESLRFALTRRYRARGDAFARLNAAQAADGVVLRVAAGAKITAPVQLVCVGTPGEDELAWHLRHVVELGEGAELTLVESHLGTGTVRQLGTVVADLVLRADACLQHVLVQDAAPDATLVLRHALQLGPRARASQHTLELGGALVRHDLLAELAGDGARLDTRGVFVPRGRQHIDTQLAIRHQALGTASSSIWRGVADGRARGVFRGAILVAPGADGSDAQLSNKNLLLSPTAEIDTKPELEIYADEVQAAHGATVGQLDERALFYLRSRGIPLVEARTLLTAAFCRVVLDDLRNVALREHLAGLLEARLPA
jgi:Fe-S cluster assembly protein SufD